MLCHKLPADDWPGVLGDRITVLEALALSKLPKSPVLSAVKLKHAVGLARAKQLLLHCDVLAEIDIKGQRRCMYLENNERCRNYAAAPCCDDHFEEAKMLSPHFRSVTLRKQYESMLNSKYKLHLDSEVAMMRLMLGLLVGKMNDGAIGLDHIVATTQLCEKIAGVVDKMAKMNSVTPETVEIMMGKVVDIIAMHVEPDKLAVIAEAIALLSPKVNMCDIEAVPGEQLDNSGSYIEAEPISIHKRALIEIAAQMHISGDEADATA